MQGPLTIDAPELWGLPDGGSANTECQTHREGVSRTRPEIFPTLPNGIVGFSSSLEDCPLDIRHGRENDDVMCRMRTQVSDARGSSLARPPQHSISE